MTQSVAPLTETLEYLKQSSVVLGLREVDTRRSLASQRAELLIEMGERIADRGPQKELEPYRVFWSVYCKAMEMEEDNRYPPQECSARAQPASPPVDCH